EFIVAIDIHSSDGARSASDGARRLQPSDPLIRIAGIVDRDWLAATSSDVVHRFDASTGRVKAARVDRYDALVLREHPVAADRAIAAEMLAAAWLEREPGDRDRQLLRRLAFAGVTVDVGDLVRTASFSARTLDDVDLGAALPPNVAHDLDRDAPLALT